MSPHARGRHVFKRVDTGRNEGGDEQPTHKSTAPRRIRAAMKRHAPTAVVAAEGPASNT